jgi:hypothetical protein
MGFFSTAALANGEALLYFVHTQRSPLWSVSTRVKTPLKYRLTAVTSHAALHIFLTAVRAPLPSLSDNFLIDTGNQP